MLSKSIFSLIFLITIWQSIKIDCHITQTLSTSKHIIKSQANIDRLSINPTINNHNKTSNNFQSDLLFGNLQPLTYQFKLNPTLNDLTVQFGHDESIWIISNNKAFVSRDSGKNYNAYSNEINVSNMFMNPSNKKSIVFTNDNDKSILYTSNDNGQDIKSQSIPFELTELFFTSNSSIMLATQVINNQKTQLWLTVNNGQNWNLLSNDLVKLWKLNLNGPQHLRTIHFKESNQLVTFNINEQQRSNIYRGLDDFSLTNDDRFFVLDNSSVYLSGIGNDTTFTAVTFENLLTNNEHLIDFYPIIMNKDETYAVVSTKLNGIVKSDLFKARDSSLSSFELSLPNINFNCVLDTNNILTRSNYESLNMNPCVEMKSLNPKDSVYIANAQNSGGKVETFIKRSIVSKWTPINFDVSNEVMNKNHFNNDP